MRPTCPDRSAHLRHRAAAAAVALLLAAAAAPVDAAPPAGKPGVILDRLAYWRYHLQGGPARINDEAMKAEGETYLKAGWIKRLKSGRGRRRGDDDRSAAGRPWWQGVLYRSGYRRSYIVLNSTATMPPPADWPAPDFDDTDWTRAKEPFMMGPQFHMDGMAGKYFNVVRGCFRTTFELPDPKAAGKLTFRMVFRGGARVFLNGREVARAFLPAGDLAPDTPAVPYHAEAYFPRKGETPPGFKKGKARLGVCVKPEVLLVANVRGAFEEADLEALRQRYREWVDAAGGPYRPAYIGYGEKVWLNRRGWERIRGLRDRRLEAVLPAGLLRKGVNVLAVEVRGSELHPVAMGWRINWGGNAAWDHGWVLDASLTAGGPAPSAMRRGGGVRLWAEDIHNRVFASDYHQPGPTPTTARIVGARNGTYAAQFVVGTDRELTGLTAEVGEFRSTAGASLPASIATVRYPSPRSAWELRALGEGKGGGMSSRPGPAQISPVILRRYCPPDRLAGADEEARAKLLKGLRFFDELAEAPPARVPAGTARPVWVSVRVPPDARPGRYAAEVTVRPGGAAPLKAAIEMDVVDWRVPDARDFRTIMALEQSPYAVARQYKVPPWSEAHFRLLGPSFALLARAGGDFVGVPVLCHTEFGNRMDSPLRVVRRSSGELELDFAALDRYLDLAMRHLGVPRCICFVVDHAGGSAEPPAVPVLDETTGRVDRLYVGPKLDDDERREIWRALAGGIVAHMKRRGLMGSLYWGLQWDYINDPSLPILLREFAPSVGWVRYCHRRGPDETYTWVATVRGGGLFIQRDSRQGWRNPRVNLWLSRSWNDVGTCYGTSLPYAYRVGPERALVGGGRGIGRMGADYWLSTWLDGFRFPGFMTGMPCLALFWPGPDGADSSIRYEVLLEGLQEAEARIFLEQALGKLSDAKLKRRASSALAAHYHATLLMPCLVPHPKLEEHASGWRRRSRRLYEAAAEVAAALGVDLAARRVAVDVPARGRKTVAVTLRNRTSRPRAWKLSTGAAWISLSRAAGEAAPGSLDVTATLDAMKLTPDTAAVGTVTLVDVTGGRTETAAIAARISPVASLAGPEPVANVICGEPGEYLLTLRNHSAAELSWRMSSSADWARPAPAAGTLPPAGQGPIAIRLAPPEKTRARHEVMLTVTDPGGLKLEHRLVVHVLPSYVAPASRPPGRAVHMKDLPAELRLKHVSRGKLRKPKYGFPFWKPESRAYHYTPAKHARRLHAGQAPRTGKDDRRRQRPIRSYDRGFGQPPASEVTYRIAGQGFTAFAAEVGWMTGCRGGPTQPKLHFEVYVDGKFAAHSGLMRPADPPRLLVADGLAGAETIRLLTRLHTDRRDAPQSRYILGVWGDPTFYKGR